MKTAVEILDTIKMLENRILEITTDLSTINEAAVKLSESEQPTVKYQLTQEQMTKLLNEFREHVVEQVFDELRSYDFDFVDDVEFDWSTSGNTAEVELEVDNSEIIETVIRVAQNTVVCGLSDMEVESIVLSIND